MRRAAVIGTLVAPHADHEARRASNFSGSVVMAGNKRGQGQGGSRKQDQGGKQDDRKNG
jgi:hypothetical protein